MMKINKSIHFMILLTFAIVFVVFYLYYTINDVKKLSIELKKTSQDVQTIATNLASINKTITELKTSCAVSVKQVVTNPVNVVVKDRANTLIDTDPSVENDEEDEEDEDEENDITHNDMKKLLLNEIDDDDDDDDISEDEVIFEIIPEESSVKQIITEEESDEEIDDIDLKSLKLDQLKVLCKKKGVSCKGTKDQLISRLK